MRNKKKLIAQMTALGGRQYKLKLISAPAKLFAHLENIIIIINGNASFMLFPYQRRTRSGLKQICTNKAI